MFSCEAYSFQTDGYGIFNISTNFDECCTREWWGGRGGGSVYEQVYTRVDTGGMVKLFLTLPHQGIEPRVFGFEFRRCDH